LGHAVEERVCRAQVCRVGLILFEEAHRLCELAGGGK
jgi:hypothetical protein